MFVLKSDLNVCLDDEHIVCRLAMERESKSDSETESDNESESEIESESEGEGLTTREGER